MISGFIGFNHTPTKIIPQNTKKLVPYSLNISRNKYTICIVTAKL